MRRVVVVLMLLFLFGCGAKNALEIRQNPAIYEDVMLDDDFQQVYRRVTSVHISQVVTSQNLYVDLGKGEIEYYSPTSGYTFAVVDITKVASNRTNLKVYTYTNVLNWPDIVKKILEAARNN